MIAYLIRRLLWMVPTFLGILVINFAVLRLQGPTLVEELNQRNSGEGAGTSKVETANRNIETYLGRFRRTGNDLPAIVNLRGFTSKADVVAWLRDTERKAGRSEAKRNRRELDLYLQGPLLVEPLAEVLRDDALADLHAPASRALSLCAYTPLNIEDLDRLTSTEQRRIQARNAALHDDRIEFVNTVDHGFVVSDPDALAKRAKMLALYDANRADFARTPGRVWSAVVVDTGFSDFLVKLFTARLYSESQKAYVFALIADRWYVTLWLNLLSIVIAWAVSIPLGIRSARRIGTWEDSLTTNGLFLLWSMPSFFLGTMLLHHLCTDTTSGRAWFPNRGTLDRDSLWLSTPRYLLQVAYHGFLPLLVLCYSSFTSLSRYMRGDLLQQLSEDYVRTARAKGCDEDRVIYRHALRNSMVTMITLGSGLLASLFGGFVIVEYIFSIPGLGTLLLKAAVNFDAPLVMGSTVISVALLLVGILVADILYGVVDPRIRSRYG